MNKHTACRLARAVCEERLGAVADGSWSREHTKEVESVTDSGVVLDRTSLVGARVGVCGRVGKEGRIPLVGAALASHTTTAHTQYT